MTVSYKKEKNPPYEGQIAFTLKNVGGGFFSNEGIENLHPEGCHHKD